jgi:hypothetical protein
LSVNTDSLVRPIRSRHREGILIKGYSLLLVAGLFLRTDVVHVMGLALVPLLLVGGYLAGVIAHDREETGELPPFAGHVGLGRNGLVAASVAVSYLGLPLAMGVVTVRGAITTTSPDSVGLMTVLQVYGGATAILLVVLSAAFVYPAAVAEAIRSGRLRAAVPGTRLRAVCTDGRYFTGWVAGAVVAGIGAVGFQMAAEFGTGGFLLGLALLYYCWLVAAAKVGEAYGAGRTRR